MTRYFMKYWLYHTLETRLSTNKALMTYSASSQYRRVNLGDIVWFVTLIPRSEHLLLFAHLEVDWLGTREDAAQRLGLAVTDLWDAPIYALPKPGSAEPFRLVDINDEVDRIRFKSAAGKRELPRFNRAQALQTMRELTTETNDMIEKIWIRY